ncbi:DUF3050 domain-containing protein [Mesonia aestuariivivens]|uniref:DUF3050 domain-containing protein n=1 Tax=Mesonia aestuariivivens TaxID=2796128 RepID=A0ABS6VY21_9FLAO|nr:DUF3050 domain-containing protein [Mesonia aestuariivivens]MBW2960492.1 DUF3050 domain-containing protein [Mesonia aestuariivivens]
MNTAHIEDATEELREQLLNHSLYEKIQTPKDLQVFMEHHVFAVWDFMSLLKALQSKLTNTNFPWYPIGNPEVRYLINEIVLAEETDINLDGKRQSHYEMYLEAMEKGGASTKAIGNFMEQIQHGTDIYLIITASDLPISVKKFLKFTFETIYANKPHAIAAAFTFGREDLIPGMFNSIITKIQQKFPKEDLRLFKYYFDRHIELDEDEHGPMALKMIEELCGDDQVKWQEVEEASIKALQNRIELWNGIEEQLSKQEVVG